jgi:hypothetical protein
MEIVDGIGVYRFSHPGRLGGLLVTVRGRVHVLGACRRGIFWRWGATIHSPARGRFDTVFGLRTRLGGIDLLFDKWLRNEIVPVRFRCNWVHGHINISCSGLYTFVLAATDPEILDETVRRNCEISSPREVEDASYYQSYQEEWDRLAGD